MLLAAVIGEQLRQPYPCSIAPHDGTECDSQELLVSEVCPILGQAKHLLHVVGVSPDVQPHIGQCEPGSKHQQLIDLLCCLLVTLVHASKCVDHL